MAENYYEAESAQLLRREETAIMELKLRIAQLKGQLSGKDKKISQYKDVIAAQGVEAEELKKHLGMKERLLTGSATHAHALVKKQYAELRNLRQLLSTEASGKRKADAELVHARAEITKRKAAMKALFADHQDAVRREAVLTQDVAHLEAIVAEHRAEKAELLQLLGCSI